MEQKLFTLFTRTPLHVGAGNSVGAIDSPVMRERHTRIPIVPGSSLKGVLSDLWKNDDPEKTKLFGDPKQAGKLLVGEVRTLAFPLRSGKGAFAWITCPLVLERFIRDSGKNVNVPELKDTMDCVAGEKVIVKDNEVVLEEYCFKNQPSGRETLGKITEAFLPLSDDPVWKLLDGRLVVVTDELFSYFVENTCEVVSRIKINDESGTAENLFNQEQVPSETLMYAVLAEFESGNLDAIGAKLEAVGRQLQIGGDETIGLGYCSIKLM